MARRKQRTNKGTAEAHEAPRSGLKEPWGSSPSRPPQYVLYCVNHENDRQYVINARELYGIRKIFDAIVGNNEIEPSPLCEKTVVFGDIDIKSDQLKAILDHQYTKAEEAFELPAPYPADIERFLYGDRMNRELPRTDEGGNVVKPERVKKEPVERKPKVDRTDKITVQQLAEEAGIDPRDARAALRKAKIAKPDGGWLGDEEWAKTIRPVLKAAAKELAKKGSK